MLVLELVRRAPISDGLLVLVIGPLLRCFIGSAADERRLWISGGTTETRITRTQTKALELRGNGRHRDTAIDLECGLSVA